LFANAGTKNTETLDSMDKNFPIEQTHFFSTSDDLQEEFGKYKRIFAILPSPFDAKCSKAFSFRLRPLTLGPAPLGAPP